MASTLMLVAWILAIQTGTVPSPDERQARLSGVVRDSSGAVLHDAALTVSSAGTTPSRSAVTDAHGQYAIEGLLPGRYIITAVAAGFEPRSIEVVIDSGAALLDIELPLSPLMERVTVTATRTGAADIQTTPLSITAVTAEALDQMGANQLFDLAGFLPSVTVTASNHHTNVKIRGVGTAAGPGNFDQSATVHLDGVYLARTAMAFMDFLDVERVEVLRGPQGTLFGRNSAGGTINVVSRQPTNEIESRLRLRAGNYSALRADGAISGPLIKDKVMGNFAFMRSSRDGFVRDLLHSDNALASEDTWAARAQLRFLFGARSELLLSGDYGEVEGVPLSFAKALAPRVPTPSFVMIPNLWDVQASDAARGRTAQQGLSAKVSVPLNATTTLSSLTAHRKSNAHAFFDPDATELILFTTEFREHHRQLSEEVTVVRRTPALTWIAGVYFYDEVNDQPVELSQWPQGRPPVQIRPLSTIDAQAWALFGEATYALSARVSLTGGIRYSDEHKDAHISGGVYLRGTQTLANAMSHYDYLDSVSFDAWTPKVSVQTQISRDTFAYLSATRGFKSGGFNPTADRPGLAYAPEYIWSYEGGVKQTMAGGRVRVNAAAFYSDYDDIQVQTLVQPGIFFVSTGAATIKGVEVETVAAASRRLQLTGQFAWLDATFDRFLAVRPGTTVEIDVPGNRLTYVPTWAGSGSAVYQIPIGHAGTTSLRGDVSWQDRVFFTAFNDEVESQGAYGLVHVRAAFEPPSRRWELAFYARNVGNQPYVTGINTGAAFPAYNGRPGEPRHWGTQFTIRR